VSYVVFAPEAGKFEVDLTLANAAFISEWHEVATGKITSAETVTGGARRSFHAAFTGPSLLFLRNSAR
jgi:hypothetical protein